MSSKEKPAFALEDALAVYAIRTNPFPIDEADDFYFATPELAKQQDALRNLVEYADLLLVVSGVEGAGKTAFLRSFLLAAGERWRYCSIEARADMRIDSLVEAMLAGFGVEGRGEDCMSDESVLRAHLSGIHANGDVALLVVDDAHLMPQICMEFLLGLAEKRGGLELRLLLASEPGGLGFSTADTKRVHVVVLKPFERQQCADYVNTRLSRAGLVGDSPFDAEVIDGIHADSGGIPGAIHPLALHTLLANAEVSNPRRRPALSARTLAYAAALLVVVGAGALVLQPQPDVDETRPRDAATSGRIKGLAAAADSAGDARTRAHAASVSRAAPGGPAVADAAAARSAKRQTASVSRIVAAKPVGADKAVPLDAPPDSPAAVAAAPAPRLGEAALGPGTGEAVIRLAKNATPKATVTDAPAHRVREGGWLERQNPSHFVIQLVGTRDATAARGFLQRHGLAGEGAWLATSHDGKPWYVVVYGAYPDRAAARAAIETLPQALRAGSPWPRTVASLAPDAR